MDKFDFFKLIGYNDEWFSLNFLPEKFVERQLREFNKSKFGDIEHYKWSAYIYILKNEDFNNFERLKEFMTLINNDPNEHLYKGAVSELIGKNIITAKNFSELGFVRFANDKILMKKLSSIK